VVFSYQRDTRIPSVVGAPPQVFAESLAYGYALRLDVEIASELLGSNRPDFQQVQWEVSVYPRLWNQTWLHLRVFGGWSAGTIPLQRKLSLAGIDTVRGYDYSLRFLGDRMLGGTVGLRMPLLRDLRIEDPWRFFGLRGVHLGPFLDAGWVWDSDEQLDDVSPRASAGLRLIAELAFGSLLRFEVAIDIAHPIDNRGRDEEGIQTWIRLQSTARGGLH
jgi:hemolysin activation/secretion protein